VFVGQLAALDQSRYSAVRILRTRVATLFPNEASLLRLVTAILMETSEEWETGKIYLNRETV
jgi:transposase-like protein